MSADEVTLPEVTNTITGDVHGASVQAEVIHGGVQINPGLAFHAAAELQRAFGSRAALEKLMADLEAVHGDYLRMFEQVLAGTPDAWEHGSSQFGDRVRAVAALLRQLRLVYEPVRVRVRITAGALGEAALSEPEREFATAVVRYFPTGELYAEPFELRTSGTAVLDHFYRSLEGELSVQLAVLVQDTLTAHRQRWLAVCQAYAALLTS